MDNWFKQRKDVLIPTAIAIVVVLVLGGIGTMLNTRSKKQAAPEEEALKKIEIPAEQQDSSQNQEQGKDQQKDATFYLEPRPDQILEILEGLDPVALDEKSQEFPGLKVMWPLYFFKIEEDEYNNTNLYLDVNENGFGITVVCDVDVNRYPQVKEAKSGDLLWVAGEIDLLDPNGTGQFYLKTEQIRFGGTKEKPPAAPEYKTTIVAEERPEEQGAAAAEPVEREQ